VTSAAAEAALAPFTSLERLHDSERGLYDGQYHELRNAFQGVYDKGLDTSIPAADHQGSLIVGVDQAHEVAEYDSMFMTESGTRENDRCVGGIAYMYCDAGRDQMGIARRDGERLIEARSQIERRGTRCGIRWNVATHSLVRDAQIEDGHITFPLGAAVFASDSS